MNTRILIKNACVITMDPALGTMPHADILVQGTRIREIAVDIPIQDAEVIDCARLIAIPGLIDTHRHLWMTVLRGFVSDGTWSSYLVEIFWGKRRFFRPEDNYIASYAGALEALDAGVTTVVDFHDCIFAPGHADESVRALEESGIRAVFCYGLEGIPNFESVSTPSRKDLSPSSDWHLADAERVRNELLDSDEARITMGITTRDLELLPFAETHRDIGFGRKLGAKRITMHAGVGALSQGARWIEALHEADLLGPDLLFSHGQSFTDTELDLIAEACSSISISPESEVGQGADPVTWRALEHAVQISLGADSVGSVSGNLFRQMQFALKLGRGSRARKLDEQGIAPSEVLLPTRTILEVATMGGARAAGLDDMVGSLTPGKRADIVLLRTDRVGMMSGAEPEHIVVLQANAGDVDSVFVDGKVAKRNGKLIGVDLSVLSAKLQASRDYITAAFADSDQSTIREAAKLVLPGV